MKLRRPLLWVLLAPAGFAQAPPDPFPAVSAAMGPAWEQQLNSIRRQVGEQRLEETGFFTFSWPRPESAPQTDCATIPQSELDPVIDEAARQKGFTPDLLRAVIRRESGYRPCAVSSKGAQGLMQLMPATADELGVKDPFDPKENIAGGAQYLGKLIERYGGDLIRALAAYNAGPTRVDTYHGLPPIPETINYVAGILGRLGDTGASLSGSPAGP